MDDINKPNQPNQDNPQRPPEQRQDAQAPSPNRPETDDKWDKWDRRRRHRGRFFPRLFWGLTVIFVGAVFLAHSLGYALDFRWGFFFAHIWPVFVIFIGLSIISRSSRAAAIIFSVLVLAFFAILAYGLVAPPAQNSASFTGRLQEELLRLQQRPSEYYYR